MSAYYEAVGASLTINSTSFGADLKSFTPNEIAREMLDKTHLGTTDYKEFKGAKLADLGEFQFVFDWDPSVDFHYDDNTERTYRVTLPLLTGQSTAAYVEFSGIVSSFSVTEGAVDSLVNANLTVKCTGTTFTVAAGS